MLTYNARGNQRDKKKISCLNCGTKFFLIKNPLKRKKSRYISVESIELSEIILKEELEKLVLIKIDIEGAEVKVVSSMMKKQIYPIQILLEIDYIRKNTIYSIIKSFFVRQKHKECIKRLFYH